MFNVTVFEDLMFGYRIDNVRAFRMMCWFVLLIRAVGKLGILFYEFLFVVKLCSFSI